MRLSRFAYGGAIPGHRADPETVPAMLSSGSSALPDGPGRLKCSRCTIAIRGGDEAARSRRWLDHASGGECSAFVEENEHTGSPPEDIVLGEVTP